MPRAVVVALCGLCLFSCTENESQVLELRQLREKLALAEKKAAEAQAAAEQVPEAPAPPPGSGNLQELADAAQKLAAAEARVAALEKELQEARNAVSAAGTEPAATKGNAENFKEFIKAMERDLLAKTGELQQAVEQTLPTANIQETTVKRLRLPDQIATAFNSAVVFIVPDTAGGMRRLEFPVQAGLDGQWRMPGVADVQKYISNPPVSTATYANNPSVPHAPAVVPQPAATLPPQPAVAVPSSQQPGAETVVINWGSTPGSTAAAPKLPNAPVTPPVQAATAAAKPPPTVPKPIMPVQQDVQIRFD